MAVKNFILLASLLGLTWIFGFLPVIAQRFVNSNIFEFGRIFDIATNDSVEFSI